MAVAKNKIEQVMYYVQTQIDSRIWTAQTRLPSVRQLAKQLGYSVSTVVEAYERLVAQGVIQAKAGSGFFVTAPNAPLSMTSLAPKRERAVDPLWISRQTLEAGEAFLKPGCGWLPEDWLPQQSMRKAIRSSLSLPSKVLSDYATPQGAYAFRQLLAMRMQSKQIEAVPEQIMLMDSATQAIDLLCRFLLKPNDTVLVDDPCYFNFQALLKVHQVNVVGVPYTAQGVDIQAFEQAIHTHQPRLYITNAGLHNPTGAVQTLSNAYQVVKLIQQANMLVIEDDIYADFEDEPAPRLSALDGLKNVIYIGSFSKTLSASLRCGFIASSMEWMDDLVDLKIATQFSHHYLSAEIIYAILTDGSYRKHIDSMKLRLKRHMKSTIAQLATLGITPWMVPKAGMFLWCQLDERYDVNQLSKDCLAQDMVLAPGNSFSQSQQFKSYLRFNVAQCQHPQVFEILAEALALQNLNV